MHSTKDDIDIEKIFHDEFADKGETPPDNILDEILKDKDINKPKPKKGFSKGLTLGVSTVVVVSTVVLIFNAYHKPIEKERSVEENNTKDQEVKQPDIIPQKPSGNEVRVETENLPSNTKNVVPTEHQDPHHTKVTEAPLLDTTAIQIERNNNLSEIPTETVDSTSNKTKKVSKTINEEDSIENILDELNEQSLFGD